MLTRLTSWTGSTQWTPWDGRRSPTTRESWLFAVPPPTPTPRLGVLGAHLAKDPACESLTRGPVQDWLTRGKGNTPLARLRLLKEAMVEAAAIREVKVPRPTEGAGGHLGLARHLMCRRLDKARDSLRRTPRASPWWDRESPINRDTLH